MSANYIPQPDLGFIAEIRGLGGETLKKCYQCATCTEACPHAPEERITSYNVCYTKLLR